MARFWTRTEIVSKIERDLGLEDEDFVDPDELYDYINEAIDEAEAEIHSLYQDYFLAQDTITLVSGTDEYTLPSDIYGHKIRKLLYKNGSTVRVIPRLPESRKFDTYVDNLTTSVTDGSYDGYFVINETAGSPKVLFTPPVAESGAYVKIFYLRNANRLTSADSVCDIPEFVSFVIQYAKVRCYEKEGHPNLPLAVQALEAQRSQMTSTLENMVPDNENLIEADTSWYERHT